MKYKLLIFDWDGTLMDSESSIVASINHAIQLVGAEPRSRDEAKGIIGLGLHEGIRKLYPEADEQFVDKMVHAYREDYLHNVAKPKSNLFEGAREVLHTLKAQDYWLAVATGKGKQGLKRVLDDTALKPMFYSTRTSEETLSKPDPLMLYEILEELDMRVEEALMIGDSVYDIQMAVNANMDALAVSYGVHHGDGLLAEGAIDIIDDIRALPNWLNIE